MYRLQVGSRHLEYGHSCRLQQRHQATADQARYIAAYTPNHMFDSISGSPKCPTMALGTLGLVLHTIYQKAQNLTRIIRYLGVHKETFFFATPL